MKCENPGCNYLASWRVTDATGFTKCICAKCYHREGWDEPIPEDSNQRAEPIPISIKKEDEMATKLPRTEEFRKHVLSLIHEKGCNSYVKLAKELGVSDPALHGWDQAMGRPIRARFSGKAIPSVPKKYQDKQEVPEEPEIAPAIGGPGLVDLEADGDELLDVIERLNQIANKKYKESIDQAEKMEKAISLLGEAMEILNQ